MKKFAIIALALMVALPASAAGVTISGYLDLGFIAAQPATTSAGVQQGQAVGSTNGQWNGNDEFNLNELNVDLASQLTNDISMFGSLDFVGNAVSIDYAYVDFANPGPFDLNLRVGRIPSVIGIEQRVSESNQTKFVNLSLLSPYTVGAIEGAAIYGSFSPVNYAVAISNSDIVDNTGGAVRLGNILTPGNQNGAANAASNNEDNNKYAISGRLGVVPIEGLEIGVYGSWDRFNAVNVAKDLERDVLGVDASYSWGAFTLKGEYLAVGEGADAAAFIADRKVRGFYVEGVYDVNSKWSVGARYAGVKDERAGAANPIFDINTISLASVYRLADNVQLKAQYDINDEKVINNNAVGAGGNPDIRNNVLALSLVASF